MMACGHAANATDEDGEPVCAICFGTGGDPWRATTRAERTIDLAGREARCSCGRTEPSNTSLAFFEFRGEGSPQAIKSCKHCGYHDVAHDPGHMETLVHKRDGSRRPTVVESGKCPGFEPRGAWEYDGFYCGCRGWD